MINTKYGKYIITEPTLNYYRPDAERTDNPPSDFAKLVLNTNANYPQGAFYTGSAWLLKAYPEKVWKLAHTHDWDEMVSFFGSNPEDMRDMGGEVEFWLEEEKFILTKTCSIFVPGGIKHGPIIVKRVDRPIFFHVCGHGGGSYKNTTKYGL